MKINRQNAILYGLILALTITLIWLMFANPKETKAIERAVEEVTEVYDEQLKEIKTEKEELLFEIDSLREKELEASNKLMQNERNTKIEVREINSIRSWTNDELDEFWTKFNVREGEVERYKRNFSE